MPKRKAPEPADDVAAGVSDKITTSSPNPHKKNKHEALAAAREWHDGRAKSGVGVGVVVDVFGGASSAAAKAGAGDGKIAAAQQQLSATSARSDEKECAVAAASAAAATTSAIAAATKKSKQEALAAAREWHDGRAKYGVDVVGGGASPAAAKAGAGKIAAVQRRSATSAKKECTAAATSAASAGKIMPEKVISTQSPLYRDVKPSKTDGGPGRGGNNAFLKSVRTEKGTALKSKNDDLSSKSTNIKSPPLTAPSTSGSTNLSSRFAPGHMDATTKKCIGIFGKSLLFLSLFALNISTAIVSIVVINGLSSSIDALRERHASDVEELVTGVSRSREVEALLRSGIRVLEREMMQAKRMDDSSADDARAAYGIDDAYVDDLPQSLEEKDDWLRGMRALEAEKSRSLENLNAKTSTLFEAGRVWSEEDGAN